MSRADDYVCLEERFPLYQQLLTRDRRAARFAKLHGWACYIATFDLGVWFAAS